MALADSQSPSELTCMLEPRQSAASLSSMGSTGSPGSMGPQGSIGVMSVGLEELQMSIPSVACQRDSAVDLPASASASSFPPRRKALRKGSGNYGAAKQVVVSEVDFRRKTRNGLFTDYIIRRTRKVRNTLGLDPERFIDAVIMEQGEVGGEFIPGVNQILEEELLGALRITIDGFCKKQGAQMASSLSSAKDGSGTSVSSKDKFRQQAEIVRNFTREAIVLKANVQKWWMRDKLLYSQQAMEERELETNCERNERLVGFWSQYHTSANKRDVAGAPSRSFPAGRASINKRDAHLYPSRSASTARVPIAGDFLASGATADVKPRRRGGALATEAVSGGGPGRSNVTVLKTVAANNRATPSERGASKEEKPRSPAIEQPKVFPPLCGPDRWKHRGAHRFPNIDVRTGQGSTLSKHRGNYEPGLSGLTGMRSSFFRDEHGKKGRSQSKSMSALASMSVGGNKSMQRQSVSLPELHADSRRPGTMGDSNTLENWTARHAKGCTLSDLCDEPTLPPPIKKQFKTPWGTSPTAAKCNSPTQEYLDACEEARIIPNLMPFITGHSTKLQASGKALSDQDLLPVVAMMSSMQKIDEVDLQGNVLLTDKSLVPLLNNLLGCPAANSMQKLNMNECLRNANRSGIQSTMEIVVKLLSDDHGIKFLTQLNLGSIAMGVQCQTMLTQAIRQHSYLRVACLADIGLRGKVAFRCVEDLMSCPSLQTLDLGWNSFNEDIFSHLGKRIVGSKMLRSLCVANCACAFTHGGDNPIQFLLEEMARDDSLTRLDISMNRMDFRGALVMEDAFRNNRRLEHLNISSNPLGVLGMRSAFRLMSQDSCVLMHIMFKDCSSSLEVDVTSGIQHFNVTNPGGRYQLRLQRPYHRALLRMLYRTCEHSLVAPEAAFAHLEFSKGKYQHAQKDSDGMLVVQTDGTLSVTFDMEPALQAASKDVDPDDFQTVLKRHMSSAKLRPAALKIIPMLAEWKNTAGSTKEQIVMLDALTRDFRFTYPQIKQLCENRIMVKEVLWRLMPCLAGGPSELYLSSLLMPSVLDHLQMLQRHKAFFDFNAQNPTGHYALDLSSPGDHAVATDLLLIDRWEAATARTLKRIDMSQRGNGSNVRNECHNDLPLRHVTSIAEWSLPESGWLQLDYSTSKRPPKDALLLDASTFNILFLTLYKADVSAGKCLDALRLVSHSIWLKATQLREMMGIFREESMRMDLCVMLIMQVVDIHNEKVFRARFSSASLKKLRKRLGQAVCFPFMQPEQTRFQFDLALHEDRLAANLLIGLTIKEHWENLSNAGLVHADGTVDPLPLGVPRGWEMLERMPTSGKFSGLYNCAPEERNFKARAALHQTYGLWRAPETDVEVMWWASLAETPQDVVEYMEFLVARFPYFSVAFRAVAGLERTEIALTHFADSIKEMGCKKFIGENEKTRVAGIFRFLDNSGEGQVSEGEWSVLGLLFKEIETSITEFAKFCTRTFGTLEEAWEQFDADGGGEIDYVKWKKILNHIGYFGPSKPIFSYLDKDHGGTISFEQFEALENMCE